MRCMRYAVLALVFALACPGTEAKEVPIPGLDMDEASKKLLDAWHARLAKTAVRLAESPIAMRRPRQAGRPILAQGTYRYDLVAGKIAWEDAARGRAVEQGWWRSQLDTFLRAPGIKFFLAHSKLRAEVQAGGTLVRVTGRSPLRALQFDKDGTLVGMTAMMPAPGGRKLPAKLQLTHTRLGGHLLMTRYVLNAPAPGGATGTETGSITWKLVLGKPIPTDIWLELRQGARKMDLLVELGPWKVDKEAHPRLDVASSRVMRYWENREYNLGRRGYRKARCDVEYERGGRITRGSYRFDGEKGSVTWQDASLGEKLGSDWHKTLDRVFQRYALREAIGVSDLSAKKKGELTIVRVQDVLPFSAPRGYQTLTFDAKSTLIELELIRRDGTRGLIKPTYRRINYPKKHIFEGLLRYMAPSAWSATWIRADGSTYTSTRSLRYATFEGTYVPSRLEIRVQSAGGKPRAKVFRFRNWRMTKVSSQLKR